MDRIPTEETPLSALIASAFTLGAYAQQAPKSETAPTAKKTPKAKPADAKDSRKEPKKDK